MARRTQVVEIGVPDLLQFKISWSSKKPALDCWGRVSAIVAGNRVWWAGHRGILWTWREMLEHLCETIEYLKFEERFPGDSSPADPCVIETHLRPTFDVDHAPTEETLRTEFAPFRERHDLSAGVNGLTLPSIWLVRAGSRMIVSASETKALLPYRPVIDAVIGFGDVMANRIARSDDSVAANLVDRWTRAKGDMSKRATISLGQSHPLMQTGNILELPDEMLAVARMAAAAPIADQQILLNVIQTVPPIEHAKLDAFSHAFDSSLAWKTPWESGYRLAREYRKAKGIPADRFMDVKDELETMGVEFRSVELTSTSIDAIAVWGSAHGPAVITNENGIHNKTEGGVRASLAHELCHLIADRSSALPFAEVLGGSTIEVVEQRARAFAAELLVPGSAIRQRLVDSVDQSAEAQRLLEDFGVTQQLLANQVKNHAEDVLDSAAEKLIDSWK